MKAMYIAFMLVLGAAFAKSANAETYNFYFDTTARPAQQSEAKPIEQSVAKAPENEAPAYDRGSRWSVAASVFYGHRDSDSVSAGGIKAGPAFAFSKLVRAYAFVANSLIRSRSESDRATFFGLEGQLTPLRLGAFDLGFVAGLSTFEKVDDNFASLHVGAQLGYAVSQRASVVVGLRANLGSVLSDAGLQIRL